MANCKLLSSLWIWFSVESYEMMAAANGPIAFAVWMSATKIWMLFNFSGCIGAGSVFSSDRHTSYSLRMRAHRPVRQSSYDAKMAATQLNFKIELNFSPRFRCVCAHLANGVKLCGVVSNRIIVAKQPSNNSKCMQDATSSNGRKKRARTLQLQSQ